jgi:Na+-translocating ferredoxin:NAD+ oxidoreductase RnfG subunit
MIAPAPVLGGQAYLHEADAARSMFPESSASARKVLVLSDAEVAALSKVLGRRVEARNYPYLDVRSEKGRLGFIFMFDVIGESQPITFAIGVTADGALQDVQVMVYREPQGEAIVEKRFRRQFVGKRSKDPITLDKDIDAVSGATISSRSATFAARKGLLLAEVVRGRASTAGNP